MHFYTKEKFSYRKVEVSYINKEIWNENPLTPPIKAAPWTSPAHQSSDQEVRTPESFGFLYFTVFSRCFWGFAKRFVRIGVDLVGVRCSCALIGRVFLQVIEHFTENGLKGAESGANRWRTKPMRDQTEIDNTQKGTEFIIVFLPHF